MPAIRLQIVCDHQMLADVLAARLAREPGAFTVHQHRSVDPDLVEAVRAYRPAVTLVDARSVVGPWSTLVDELVEADPHVRVAVLAGTDDADDAVAAARRCLAAWLPPDVTADHVVEVLRAVAAGHTVYPATVLGAVLHRFAEERHDRTPAAGPLAALTGRERAVLTCLVAGRRDQEIAEHLDMAPTTVRTHSGRILRKLGVHSRLEAVRLARRHGLTLAVPAPRERPGGRGRPSEYRD